MKYAVLLIVALILFIVMLVVGLVYSAGSALRHWNGRILVRTFYGLSFGIDQAGNVGFADLWNDIFVKDRQRYPFGSPDMTISHVLGVNKDLKNLTWFGRFVAGVLNFIDKKHVEKAADNHQFRHDYLPDELK